MKKHTKDESLLLSSQSFYCDDCRTSIDEKNTIVVTKPTLMKFRGEEFLIDKTFRICTVCKNEIVDDILDTQTLQKLSSAYAEKYEFNIEDIKELRSYYGFSQLLFSKLLNVGIASIKRYETGTTMPTPTIVNIFKSLKKDKSKIIEFYESNELQLTIKDKKIVLDMLNKLFSYPPSISKKNIIDKKDESNNELIAILKGILNLHYNDINKSLKTGFSDFNSMKFINLILYFSQNILWNDLNILLFYADFLKYKRIKRPFTGAAYIKHKYGPIPKDYDLILSFLENEKLIIKEIEEAQNGFMKIKLKSEIMINKKQFDLVEQEVISVLERNMQNIGLERMKEIAITSINESIENDSDLLDYENANRITCLID